MEEEIRREAYQIYLKRQREGIPGDDKGDWKDAESKIRRKDFECCFTPDMVNRLERYL